MFSYLWGGTGDYWNRGWGGGFLTMSNTTQSVFRQAAVWSILDFCEIVRGKVTGHCLGNSILRGSWAKVDVESWTNWLSFYSLRAGNLHHSGMSHTIRGWAMPWSSDEMLVGQHQRVDVSARARNVHKGPWQKRLEEDLCWIVPHVPLRIQLVKGLSWTDLLKEYLAQFWTILSTSSTDWLGSATTSSWIQSISSEFFLQLFSFSDNVIKHPCC